MMKSFKDKKDSLKRKIITLAIICIISYAMNFLLSFTASCMGLLNTSLLRLVSNGIITILAVLMPFVAGKRFLNLNKDKKPLKYKRKDTNVNFVLIVIFGFAACVSANFITSLTAEVFPFIGGSNIPLYNDSLDIIILTYIVLAVMPAICEETAFRGIVMDSLLEYGDRIAIIISALMFAILHQTLSGVIFAFLSGLIFGFIKKLTDSLIQSMAVHFLNNALSITMAMLSKSISNIEYAILYYTVVIISIFLTIIGGCYIHLNNKKNYL